LTGDFNGDGFDDIIIGALRTTNLFSGAAYVIYGGNNSLASGDNIHINSLGARGFVLTGASWAWCGYSVSGAGNTSV
jgi:hypothetical protein